MTTTTSPAAPAALVQQVDDTVGEGTQTNPGERLRDALQPLVVDGTLTASQADSVATHLVENRPERGDRGDRGNHGRRGPGKFARSEVLTELLGVGADELREELRAGSTLAEIAAANGVETSAVIAALVTQAEERINTAVEAERITAEEARGEARQDRDTHHRQDQRQLIPPQEPSNGPVVLGTA